MPVYCPNPHQSPSPWSPRILQGRLEHCLDHSAAAARFGRLHVADEVDPGMRHVVAWHPLMSKNHWEIYDVLPMKMLVSWKWQLIYDSSVDEHVSKDYGLWYLNMVFECLWYVKKLFTLYIYIYTQGMFQGMYKPTNITGRNPHCSQPP